ncbi:MAG: hypothetical protein ABIH03_11805 [Pseudomonadota bacterium]
MQVPKRYIKRRKPYIIGATPCPVAGYFHASPGHFRMFNRRIQNNLTTDLVERFDSGSTSPPDRVGKAEAFDTIVGNEIADDDIDFPDSRTASRAGQFICHQT